MSQTTKQTSKAPSSSTSTPSFQITAQARQLPRRPDHGIETISADRKSTRLNSSHSQISYAVFCLKKNNESDSVGDNNRPLSMGLSPCIHQALTSPASTRLLSRAPPHSCTLLRTTYLFGLILPIAI